MGRKTQQKLPDRVVEKPVHDQKFSSGEDMMTFSKEVLVPSGPEARPAWPEGTED